MTFIQMMMNYHFKGGITMGDHHKSNREVRKRKYAEQFTKTERNKKEKSRK